MRASGAAFPTKPAACVAGCSRCSCRCLAGRSNLLRAPLGRSTGAMRAEQQRRRTSFGAVRAFVLPRCSKSDPRLALSMYPCAISFSDLASFFDSELALCTCESERRPPPLYTYYGLAFGVDGHRCRTVYRRIRRADLRGSQWWLPRFETSAVP